jgi:phage tail-like protein
MPVLPLNAAFGAVSSLLGVRLDPYASFNFLVEIEGILSGGFSECSGLVVETEFVDYREGGENGFVHRFVGATKYPPLILKHGITLIDGLWGWHQDVANLKVTRHNGTIYLLDKQRIPVMWWDFKEALPVKWTGPELRAQASAIAFESVELTHRGLSKPRIAAALAGLGAELLGAVGGAVGGVTAGISGKVNLPF